MFDEIDTGIGGRAAEAVGRKLKSLARSNQVLCVTHLAQVAAFADCHYVVAKVTSDVGAATQVELVVDDQRVEELAGMLAGTATDAARQSARELLGRSIAFKGR